jgi:hypothetical protein
MRTNTVVETAPSSTPSLTAVARLVRRLGDLEVPAPGTWPVLSASHVAIAAVGRGDHPIPMRIVGGALDVHETPERSTISLELRSPAAMTFVGRSTTVEANQHGMSRWSFAGQLSHEGGTEPMQVSVTYHGVYRTTGRTWAWFSGTGAARPLGRRSWLRPWSRAGRRLVVMDLLLNGPETPQPSSEVSGPGRSGL